MANMKKEEARRAVLSEYDLWAKKHPNDARIMGGFLFFRYLQKERSDLLDLGLATSGKPFMAGYGIGLKIRITSPPSVRRFSFDHLGSRPPSLTRFRRSANLAEKLQNVTAVTEAPSKFWQETQIKRGARS